MGKFTLGKYGETLGDSLVLPLWNSGSLVRWRNIPLGHIIPILNERGLCQMAGKVATNINWLDSTCNRTPDLPSEKPAIGLLSQVRDRA